MEIGAIFILGAFILHKNMRLRKFQRLRKAEFPRLNILFDGEITFLCPLKGILRGERLFKCARGVSADGHAKFDVSRNNP